MSTTLRQRIIAKMPFILKLIASERRGRGMGGDADFRSSIIRSIARIAELETMSPLQARRAFDRIAKDERRLELSIAKLPSSARRHVKVEVRGLDDARKHLTKETGRTAARQ